MNETVKREKLNKLKLFMMQNAGEVICLIVGDCVAFEDTQHSLNIPMHCQIHAYFQD